MNLYTCPLCGKNSPHKFCAECEGEERTMCDEEECDKPATMNVEQCAVGYPIEANGDLGEPQILEGHGDSLNYCDDHLPTD